jgi:dienelactone hydrolase
MKWKNVLKIVMGLLCICVSGSYVIGSGKAMMNSLKNKYVFVFVHGVKATEQQMHHYHKPQFDIMCGSENRAFNLPVADEGRFIPTFKFKIKKFGGLWMLRFNPAKLSFAQECEIIRLNEVCSAITQPLVLVGMSLGATTILNYAGTYKNDRLKALVVEAPFDHISTVIHTVFSAKIVSRQTITWVLEFLTAGKFKADGPHAEDIVKNIDPSLPILLIHSKNDRVIPLQSSIHLYQELRKSGHANVHLLVLNKGRHGMYQTEKYGSPKVYQATVHAFYKKYGLPHDEILAQEGAEYFAQCQPEF